MSGERGDARAGDAMRADDGGRAASAPTGAPTGAPAHAGGPPPRGEAASSNAAHRHHDAATRIDSPSAPPLLVTRDLARDYAMGGDRVHAVRGVSLELAEGDWVAIVGPSGCGKSTLLNLLGAIDRPDAGSVVLRGRDVADMRDREATRFRLLHVGFVFQRFYLMPTLSARENVELPMAEAGVPKAERRRRADELLAYVGLAPRARHRPSELSGGEQQRVAIARALANRPAILLADEPTGELDAATGAEVIALFERLNRDGTTIVVVTHDEELAQAARRVIHMKDGRVVKDERLRGLEMAERPR